MLSIESATTMAGLVLIGAFGVVIAVALLTGQINTRGLLRRDGFQRSTTRLTALLAALVGSGVFLADILADPQPETMPDVSGAALLLLLGANGVYIVGKARLAVFDRLLRRKQ